MEFVLRSLYTKRNQGLIFQFILGKAKKRLGSSVLHYQAREQGFRAALKAWKQTLKTSPSPKFPF